MGDTVDKVVNIDLIIRDKGTAAAKRVNGQLKEVVTTTENVKKGYRVINQETKYYNQATQQATKATGNLTSSLIGAGTAMLVAHRAFSVMQQSVTDGLKSFREFETRMAEVSTILSSVDMDILPSLTRGVEKLSITFGKSTSDISKGLYDILSAAFATKDAMHILNVSVKASIAGLSDVRSSVDIFTTVLNAYGMSAHRVTEISDIMFQSLVRGKFQFEELNSALQYVVPIAAQAGVSINELMATLSATTRHGLRLDMTARGLALGIQNIVNPTEKARKAALEYGIDMSAVGLRLKGLTGFLKDLNEKTKIYGSQIIPELISNMRSLRVMMVASGEGFEGVLEDMELLEESTNAANTALEKMMDTEQKRLDQAEQLKEMQERALGKQWQPLALGWEYFKGGIASFITSFGNVGQMMNSTLGLIIDMATETAGTSNAFTDWLGEVEKIEEEMKSTQETILIAKNALADLNTELKENIKYGDQNQYQIKCTLYLEKERILAEQYYADLQHDVTMGMQFQNYVYKTTNATIRNAINEIKKYEKATESAREESTRYTLAIKENNLAILKLQLRGMMRRRGLTRGEERTMKKLRIENLQARIEHEENNTQMTVSDYDRYLESKKIVDDELALAREKIYQLNYTYNNDLVNHNLLIKSKIRDLASYEEAYINHLQRLEELNAMHLRKMAQGRSDPYIRSQASEYGYPLEENFAQGIIRRILSPRGKFPTIWEMGLDSNQTGTYRVPRTGPAWLHEGEQVVPKGSNRTVGMGGGKIHVDPMNINVNIYDHTGVEQLVQKIELAIQGGLISGITTGYS